MAADRKVVALPSIQNHATAHRRYHKPPFKVPDSRKLFARDLVERVSFWQDFIAQHAENMAATRATMDNPSSDDNATITDIANSEDTETDVAPLQNDISRAPFGGVMKVETEKKKIKLGILEPPWPPIEFEKGVKQETSRLNVKVEGREIDPEMLEAAWALVMLKTGRKSTASRFNITTEK